MIEELYLIDVRTWINDNQPFIPPNSIEHDPNQFRETVHEFLEFFLYNKSKWNVVHDPVPEDHMDKIHPWITHPNNNRIRLGLSNAIFRIYQRLASLIPPELEQQHWGVWSHHNLGRNRIVFTMEGDYRLMQMAMGDYDAAKSENLYP